MDQTLALWLIGQAVAAVGALIMVHRNIVQKIEVGDNALHERVNDVREKYVRRDDLDAHLNVIRNQIDKMDVKLDRILEGQRKAN